MKNRERLILRAALDLWLRYGRSSEWVKSGPLEVYVRKTPVYFMREPRVAITIANVSVRFDARQQGWFRELILWGLEQDIEMLKLENVLAERVKSICLRHGWTPDNNYPQSFYAVVRMR